MKHLLIAGSRTYDNRDELYRLADEIIGEENDSVIIECGAAGADMLTRDYALEHGLELVEYTPEQGGEMIAYVKDQDGIALVIWDEEDEEVGQRIEEIRQAGISTQVWSTKSGGFL